MTKLNKTTLHHAVIITAITSAFTFFMWGADDLSKFPHNDSLFLGYFAVVSIISIAVRLLVSHEKGIHITFWGTAIVNLLTGVIFILHIDKAR